MPETGTTDEDFALTDLSERLHGPEGTRVAEETRRRLESIQSAISSKIDAGLPIDEYERLVRISDALASAYHVMLLMKGSRASSKQGTGVET